MIILRQRQYAAISENGVVAMTTKDALEEARNLGYTKKAAVKAAKRILDRARDSQNSKEGRKKLVHSTLEPLLERTERKRMGFVKSSVRGISPIEHFKEGRTKIGFRPDYTETSGQPIKLGFRKFSKTDREIVPADIVKRVKEGDGVIQKDHNGDWRIISMKTKTNKSGKPEFWDARYDSKEAASKALGGYFANKH